MFYKFHHHLVTIDSEYLPQPTETRSNHRKNNPHTATPSPTAGHNTDRCHSSSGPSPNGTACPRKLWQANPWTVSSPGLLPTCNQTDHPSLPHPLLFLMFNTPLPLLCHTPFHYISEVSAATSKYQHNHHNIDVG